MTDETNKYFLTPATDMRIIVRKPSFLTITTTHVDDVQVSQKEVMINGLRDEIKRLNQTVSDLRFRLREYEDV